MLPILIFLQKQNMQYILKIVAKKFTKVGLHC